MPSALLTHVFVIHWGLASTCILLAVVVGRRSHRTCQMRGSMIQSGMIPGSPGYSAFNISFCRPKFYRVERWKQEISEMIGKRFIFLPVGCVIFGMYMYEYCCSKKQQLRGEKAGTFIPACVGFVAPDKSSLDAEQRKLNDSSSPKAG